MSNLVPSNIQIPAHLTARVGAPSALAQSMTGGISSGGGESFPRISIKSSRFRIVEGDTETLIDQTYLDVVVVGANPRLSKAWYAKAWSKDADPTAPDCFSLDGIGPDASAESPQNDLCATCPQNAWGSKVTDSGQQVKACSDKKRLAIVAADDPSGPVYLLEVTPAALKNLNQYQKELAVRGIPAEIVKTRISFDPDASFPKLMFKFSGFIEAETQQVVDKLFGTDEVKAIIGEIVAAQPVPKAVPKAAPLKAVPAPQPVVEEVAEVEEEAPAPKRGFGAKKAAEPAPVKAAPKAAPKAAKVEADDASSLADEIAALIGEVDADDE